MAKSVLLIDPVHNIDPLPDELAGSISKLISEFRQQEFDVSTAGNASDALRLLETAKFDVVVLEVQLPKGRREKEGDTWQGEWFGLDILRRIRQGDFGRPNQPVVILAFLNSRDKRDRIQALDPTRVLGKPGRSVTIIEACQEACLECPYHCNALYCIDCNRCLACEFGPENIVGGGISLCRFCGQFKSPNHPMPTRKSHST